MTIYYSSKFKRSLKKLKNRRPDLISKIKQRISLFQSMPNHPSLRPHKLKGKKVEIWSFSIESDLRITFTKIPQGVFFINIGSHDEVY